MCKFCFHNGASSHTDRSTQIIIYVNRHFPIMNILHEVFKKEILDVIVCKYCDCFQRGIDNALESVSGFHRRLIPLLVGLGGNHR